MNRFTRIAPIVLVVAAATLAVAQEKKPPKRASSPFKVYVSASPKGEADAVEAIHEGREELEKRLKKKNKWFALVSDPSEAEIAIDVQAYWVREERRTHDQRHVAGAATHTMQVDTLFRHHSLRTMSTFFGAAREMTGTQVKRGGGSAKGAAKDLADRLERYCKEHYWELKAKQDAQAGSS